MRTDGLPDGDPQRPDVTLDAVVVIPGVMGSELVDRATGRVLWGLADVGWLASAWTRRDGLAPLALSDAEREQLADGTYDPGTARVKPTRLLRVPTAAPFLGGFEPYTRLLGKIREVVAHPDAVRGFAYDWRLPVELNARLLAAAAHRHLATWREHDALAAARRQLHDERPARLVIVAHSMGGLLARGLALVDGPALDLRATITLGTPFYGSVKAAVLLNTGRGAPLPHRQLRQVAATLPGVHDLLPTYRCLVATGGDGREDVVRLTAADVAALGGDHDLAIAALGYHERLEATPLVGHRALVGTGQPTLQSLSLDEGVVTAERRSYLWHDDGELKRDPIDRLLYKDYKGDGTVFRYAATPLGTDATGLAQTHGALAAGAEAAAVIRAVLTDQRELGIRLGVGDLGLEVPDVVTAGGRFPVAVTGEDDPAAVTCVVTQIEASPNGMVTERPVARPLPAARRDGAPGLTVGVKLPEPGLYRIAVKTGGRDPVTELVLCVPDDVTGEG